MRRQQKRLEDKRLEDTGLEDWTDVVTSQGMLAARHKESILP